MPFSDRREQRQVTIMFVDIVKSSELLKKFDVEDVEKIFDRTISEQIKICIKHGGIVNQVMGDGLMCVFGADLFQDGQVLQAMAAAEEMQESNSRNLIGIRISINTGTAILKPADNDSYRAKYQVIGSVVHIADKMLKMAKPNRIVVSGSSKACLDRFFSFRKLKKLVWIERETPIYIYERVVESAPSQGLQAADRSTILVRTGEAREILAYMREPVRAAVKVSWLQGEPGLGKTYMAEHVALASGDCFKRIIKLNFYPPCVRDKMHKTGLPRLLKECNAAKTLLLLEDMQWAKEEELQQIKEYVCGAKASWGLQLLCTSTQNAPFEMPGLKVFMLAPLSLEQSLKLLRSDERAYLVGNIETKLCHLCKGNPYFMMEYLQWIKNKRLHGVSHRNILRHIDQRSPAGLTDFIYSRLNGLDARAITIAKMAAVQGLRVDLDLLMTMSNQSRAQVIESMTCLEQARVLQVSKCFPAPVWTFSHAVFQKVIYSCIPKSARLHLHGGIIRKLRALRALRGLSADNTYQLMAYHAQFVNNPAILYLASRRAAMEMKKLSRHDIAVQYLKTAEKALAKIKGRLNRRRHQVQLNFMMMESLLFVSQYAATKRKIDVLLSDRKLLAGLGLLKKVLSFQGLYFWIKRDTRRAEKISLAVLELNKNDFDRDTHFRDNLRLANMYLDQGRPQKAVTHANLALRELKKGDDHEMFGLLTQAKPTILCSLTLAYAELGDLKAFKASFAKTQAALEGPEDYFTRSFVFLYLAYSLIVLGRYAEAREFLKPALAFSQRMQSTALVPSILAAYGLVTAKLGDAREGIRNCKKSLDIAKQKGMLARRPLFFIWYAEALMADGKLLMAARYLQKAVRETETTGEERRRAHAYLLLAECYRLLSARDRKYLFKYKNYQRKAQELVLAEGLHGFESRLLKRA